MSNIHFLNSKRHTESTRYWMWRDLKTQMAKSKQSDVAVHEDFSRQAQRVREQVDLLLGAGDPGAGADQALSALAEEDMTNFCVMVDLAADVKLDEVDALSSDSRDRLTRFLSAEPWRSLAVDNDMSVALALLDSVGAPEQDTPLSRLPLGLLDVVESVLRNVNHEQYHRFVQEFEILKARDKLSLPSEANGVFVEQLEQAAARLGVKPPGI